MSNEFLMLDLVGKDTLFAFLSHRVPEIFHFLDFKMAVAAILKKAVFVSKRIKIICPMNSSSLI
jgi:hypothetical protein